MGNDPEKELAKALRSAASNVGWARWHRKNRSKCLNDVRIAKRNLEVAEQLLVEVKEEKK
jgi:hypothetical protein